MSDVDCSEVQLRELNDYDRRDANTDSKTEESGPTSSPPSHVSPKPPSPRRHRGHAFCHSCKRRLSRHSSHYPHGDVECECEGSTENILSAPSLCNLLGEDVTSDDFQAEVANKSQTLLIGRQEAEIETMIDRLICKKGDKEKALMFIIQTFPSEAKVGIFVNTLLHRGANPSTCDCNWQTPLHHAVKRNFKGVCSKLLENDALPHVRDKDNNMPYHIALKNNNDDIAALLITYMPNAVVRSMYVSRTAAKSECSLHELLLTSMQQTALGVLDCMMDPIGDTGKVKVYYHALEADDKGRPPTNHAFDAESRCCLHLIAKEGLKDIVFHDCVRLLIRRKWKDYVRFRFVANSISYCITLFCLTFSLAVATLTPDPTLYPDPLAIVRGVMEVWSCIAVFFTLCLELNQMRKHRLDYWKEKFNWLDLASSLLLLTVIPLRFTQSQEQWHVFSIGYLLWTLKIFKYAAVFRQTGAYALILVRILGHDFVQFTIFFSVILLAFSGSFVLALRGENSLNLHQESGTFWDTLFTGIRILIESDPVVEYYGEKGYKPLSCILLVIFLITCCVVLLNILIAQLSDTYQNIQDDAQRGLELNRAWIISRIELNSILIRKGNRIRKYCESEVVYNPHGLLERWETPPMSDMSKNIRGIWDSVESNKLNLLTIENRLARQEQSLTRMQQVLDEIASCCLKKAPSDQRDDNNRNSSSDHVTGNMGGISRRSSVGDNSSEQTLDKNKNVQKTDAGSIDGENMQSADERYIESTDQHNQKLCKDADSKDIEPLELRKPENKENGDTNRPQRCGSENLDIHKPVAGNGENLKLETGEDGGDLSENPGLCETEPVDNSAEHSEFEISRITKM